MDQPSSSNQASTSSFLRLIPHNQDALDAFRDLVSWLKTNEAAASKESERLLRPYTRFMHIEETTREGFYFLSLDVSQSSGNGEIGWLIGAGRWSSHFEAGASLATRQTIHSQHDGGADFQLLKPWEDPHKYGGSGLHARLYFDKTGKLVLEGVGRRGPDIRFAHGSQNLASGSPFLVQGNSLVEFGQLRYSIQYTPPGERGVEYFGSANPNPQIVETLISPDVLLTLEDWVVINAIETWQVMRKNRNTVQGTVDLDAVLCVAKHTPSGEIGLAKQYACLEDLHEQFVGTEIQIWETLKQHPRMLQLRKVNRRGSTLNDITLICTPSAPHKIKQSLRFSADKSDTDRRILAFRQLLDEVAVIHRHGFIHRNITMQTWKVVDFSPEPEKFRTIIADYSHAVIAESFSSREDVPTNELWHAPEMRLEPRILNKYGPEVDIWACGIIAIMLFFNGGLFPFKESPQSRQAHSAVIGRLRSTKPYLERDGLGELYNLAMGMLEYAPKNRPTAEKALENPIFDRVRNVRPANP